MEEKRNYLISQHTKIISGYLYWTNIVIISRLQFYNKSYLFIMVVKIKSFLQASMKLLSIIFHSYPQFLCQNSVMYNLCRSIELSSTYCLLVSCFLLSGLKHFSENMNLGDFRLTTYNSPMILTHWIVKNAT